MASFDHLFIEPSDFGDSLRFYTADLGWEVTASWGGDGSPRGAHLRSPGGMVLVMAEDHEDMGDHAKKGGMVGTRPTIHVRVPDLDAAFDALPDKSVVDIAPEDTHWGSRWFVVRDPDGNLYAYEESK